MKRSSIAVACATLALALAPGMAKADPTVTVNVGGTSYDVTYFDGSYDSNTYKSKFQIPPTGQMPWWGDSGLAQSFATQVAAKLGILNGTGPRFAHKTQIGPAVLLVDDWRYNGANTVQGYSSSADSHYYATASIALNPIAVPGPLPLFGAAAAFGVSRRLRRRIQLGG